jgi:hypothetical protein
MPRIFAAEPVNLTMKNLLFASNVIMIRESESDAPNAA